jgi:hypothetical protein
MFTRSRAAIAAFFAAVVGLSLLHNRKLYGPGRWDLVVRKSFVDMAILCLIAVTLPIVLIAWSGAYVTDKIVAKTWDNRYWFVTVAVFVGMGLTAISAICFEVIALLSVLPVNIISGKIWQKYEKRILSN